MKVPVLGRRDIESVIEMRRVIAGVEEVYRLKARGETEVWPLVNYEFADRNAAMDIRSGFVKGDLQLHGMKMLNNFPSNREKGLPPFNGMLMIYDSNTGIPLGVMDAAYVTCMRTGAAGALGASRLARKDSEHLLLLGAGKQAAYQIAASLILMPGIKRISIADPVDAANAVRFAAEIPERLASEFQMEECKAVKFEAVSSLRESVSQSDVIITITPSKKPLIQKAWVKPGTHFSCIGSDMEGKEEIDPEIFRGAKLYADDRAQCIRVGEMELPLKEGVISEEEITGEIGELLEGRIPGRSSEEEITIFDATGLALLDLVAGKAVIDLAKEKGIGFEVEI